jgi:transposase InsO family protein
VPSLSPSGSSFFQRWRDHANARDVATQLSLPLRTVQRLFARFERLGDAGVATGYAACGQQQAARTPPLQVEQFCQTRRDHRRWGSEMIRLELTDQHDALPCARTIRRHLRQAGLQPAPPGRPPALSPRVARATGPHQRWQIDAAEELRLADGSCVCWLRVVDECSGAFLMTVVFACGRWEHVSRHAIQEALRGVFRVWGLPQEIRVDNGYPWGNSSDFPPEVALWLIGLGVAVVWIPPGCPQDNGVVERSQDIGQDWFEPQTCADAAALQRRCDELDRRQRERYPYRGGQSRWAVYPGLHHSGRAYRPHQEARQWDVKRVWAALAGQVGKRTVDCTGCVSVYHRNRYLGKPHIGREVYVTLDPTGPTWVISDHEGRQLRTHPAAELAAECIRRLAVAGRKGKQARK